MGNATETHEALAEELCEELVACTASATERARFAWEAGEDAWTSYLTERIVAGLEAGGLKTLRWQERSACGASEVVQGGHGAGEPGLMAVLSGRRQASAEQVLYDLWKALGVRSHALIVVAAPDPASVPDAPAHEFAQLLQAELTARSKQDACPRPGTSLLLGSASAPWRLEAFSFGGLHAGSGATAPARAASLRMPA